MYRRSQVLACIALMLTACEALLYVDDTPTATSAAPAETQVPARTEAPPTATQQRALYEAEVIVERLRLRDAAGEDSGEYLPFGKAVTVIEQRDVLGDLAVPEPPGGQWCLIAPEELGDWVACGYLSCTRHCAAVRHTE